MVDVVTTITAESSGGAAISFSLTGAQEDDVVFVGVVYGGNAEVGMSSAGYTSIGGGSTSCSVFGYYKRMGSSPDANAIVNAGTVGQGRAAICAILRDVHETTVIDATATDATATTTNPDPASITTATNNALVMALAGSEVGDTVVTSPSGYSTVVNIASFGFSGGQSVSAAMAHKTVVSAGAEDPGPFSGWSSGNWRTLTIAFKSIATVSQQVDPSLFSDADTFFSPTLSQQVNLLLFSDEDTFFAPALTQTGAFTVTPSLLVDADTFFAPALAALLSPGLFEDPDEFYEPVVTGFAFVPVFDLPPDQSDYGMRDSHWLTKSGYAMRRR